MGVYSGTTFLPPQIEHLPLQNDVEDVSSGVQSTTTKLETVTHEEEQITELTGVGIESPATATYALAAAATTADQEVITLDGLELDITPGIAEEIIEGSVILGIDGSSNYIFFDRNGKLYRDFDGDTGAGIECGTINYQTGQVTINHWGTGITFDAVRVIACATKVGGQPVIEAHFRTPGAPLRPGSLSVQGTTVGGETVSATADFTGQITGEYCCGGVDVETGIVNLYFGAMMPAAQVAGNETEPWYDVEQLQTNGDMWIPTPVASSSLTYSCVVYSYLPLDAELIGIDPVRLPSDGRVAICKDGYVVVVHHTENETMPSPLASSQVVNLSRDDVSLIELYDADGVYVPSAGIYTVNLEAGTVTMDDALDLSGYTEPLIAQHRREDMCLVTDVQINGQISVASAMSHDYPDDGNTYISSALPFGDLAARATNIFDQKTWTDVWSNELIGDPCTANYNTVTYPFTLTNEGAIEERWMLKFTSTETFDIIGETVGNIGTGAITIDCAPLNPSTGAPYFTIDSDGWGSGWATGNLVRFNTLAGNHDMWIARTTLSGPVTEPADKFVLQIRGTAD